MLLQLSCVTEGYELPLLENNAPNNPLMEDGKQKKATPEWNELIKSKPFFDLGAKVSYDSASSARLTFSYSWE